MDYLKGSLFRPLKMFAIVLTFLALGPFWLYPRNLLLHMEILHLMRSSHAKQEEVEDKLVLVVTYLPTIGYWLLDKVGANQVEAATEKGNTYSWGLLFGQKKKLA